ncbi:MAG TPA: hypothetical protein VMX57_00685 [Planctomycetota bacterium]|nr:hypothetical protein [Planctomycetota bacterium]
MAVLWAVCAALAAPAAAQSRGQSPVLAETVSESFEDFEKPKLDRCWRAHGGLVTTLVNAGVTGGRQALQVTFPTEKASLHYRRTGLDGYGSSYSRSLEVLGARFIFNNAFAFDVLNPGTANVRLVVTFAERPFVFTVKPGANTISIPTDEIAAGVYRMTQTTHAITFQVQKAQDTTLIFDSLRLERESVGPNMKRCAKCFDFGPSDMVRPGFVGVDHKVSYESRRGYGWLMPNVDDEKGKLTTDVSTGAVPLGDLIRDGVRQLSSPFLIDCPNGKYRVHIVGGYHWGGIFHLMPVDYDFMIKAEGEVKYIQLRASDQAERVRVMYGHDRTWYTYGEDLWETFGKPVYGPMVFDVDVTDGQLSLEFVTSPQPDQGFLNYMVVYPVGEAEKVEPELRRLSSDVRHRYDRVSFRELHPTLAVALKKPDLHEEYLSPHRRTEKISILAARPEYSGRDFMVYARDHLEQVYPDTVPDPDEETRRLSAVGTPGETVPLTFSIFALHAVEDVRLELEPLEGPRDRRLLPEDVDVRTVRYSRRMLAQQSRGDWQYMVVPWYLVEFRTLDVERYMSRRFWLNVRLSSDLPPGQYTGEVRVRTARSGTVALKLDLEVLPFRLRRPDPGRFATVYFVQPFDYGNEPYGNSVRSQATAGLPGAHAWSVRRLFERLHRQEIRSMLRTLETSGFDTLYAGDWLADVAEANRMLLVPMRLLSLPDVSRGAKRRPRSPGEAERGIYVDEKEHTAYISALAGHTAETVEGLRAEKLKVYLGRPSQWMDLVDDPGVVRFLSGVYLWRSGADGVVIGPARSSWGDPYHPFDGYGGEPGSLVMPASTRWPVVNTSRILEETREGIKDYRYILTLESLIDAAGDRPETAAARKFLEHVREETSGALADYVEETSGRTWRTKHETAWSASRYNLLRHDLATHIVGLRTVLGEPTPAEGPRVRLP